VIILKQRLHITSTLLVGLLLYLLFFMTTTDGVHKFIPQNIIDWHQDWQYNDKWLDLNGQSLKLKKGALFKISKQLPETNLENQYLLVRGSLADLTVVIDGENIYQSSRDQILGTKSPPASLWHFIPLHRRDEGKEISLTFASPYYDMSGLANPIYMGYQSDLMFFIIQSYGVAFFIDVIILVLGFIMLLTSLVRPQKIDTNMWSIGIFSILVSLWLFSESRLLQFFIGNQWLHASLAYLCLAIVPIPLLLFIGNATRKKYQSIIYALISISFINLFIIIGLQWFHIIDFYESVKLSHIIILIDICVICRVLWLDVKRYRTATARNTVYAIVVLFAFITIEIIQFLIWNSSNVTIFVRIGLLIFILILGYGTLRQLFIGIEKSYKTSFYKRLAYKDQLTQGNNRMAFERDMEKLFKNPEKLDSLRLVILDMNDLKLINDTYGHVTGDEAIKKAYKIIEKCFEDYGKSYRIGGDEFAVLIEDSSELTFDTLLDNLYKRSCEHNRLASYPFSIAYGYVIYDPKADQTAEKMMHRADSNMYYEKNSRYKGHL
jgi:diguanylate cyclase (GGDEF)-like protein